MMAMPARIGRRLPNSILPDAKLQWSSKSDMNKTETRYAIEVLEPALIDRDIAWYCFEGFKLRLGRKNFLTPDFAVLTASGALQMHEVKAVWTNGKVGFREDARQKLRDAVENYPFIQFIVAAREKSGGWRYEHPQPFMKKPLPGFPDKD
jgi:hypothetical protein